MSTLAQARFTIRAVAENGRLPPRARSRAAELVAELDALITVADRRRSSVRYQLEEITREWDEYDVLWIERRQRATEQPLIRLVQDRFVQTAARALRKAIGSEGSKTHYAQAACRVASGEWHYLELCPYLNAAHVDLNPTEAQAAALDRTNQRLSDICRYANEVEDDDD